jgi:hypothetical protein
MHGFYANPKVIIKTDDINIKQFSEIYDGNYISWPTRLGEDSRKSARYYTDVT